MQDPSRGLLGRPRTSCPPRVIMVVQYWKSSRTWKRHARDPHGQHLCVAHIQSSSATTGRWGFFHETYRVAATDAETVYVNMPVFGLPRRPPLFPCEEAARLLPRDWVSVRSMSPRLNLEDSTTRKAPDERCPHVYRRGQIDGWFRASGVGRTDVTR